MSKLFAKFLEEHTPKVNEHVMNGLATHYLKDAEQYIDIIFRSSQPVGIVYEGYERCSPEEEFHVITKDRNNKRIIDLAKSNLYMVKYNFSFEGKALPPKYLYLPFVEQGGILHLGGPKFHITPVLSDKVVSPGYDTIFVRLLKDKINFKRCYHTLIINGVRETVHVIWSALYRKPSDTKVPVTTRANTTVAHYLFAKYGVNNCFKMFCGFEPVIGYEEVNEKHYPRSDWIICKSTQVKPKTFIGDFYVETKLNMAVPVNLWNDMTKALVTGFFYTVDHFPNRFNVNNVNNPDLWKILLGHIVFSGVYGENKLFTNISEHFISLDEYLDEINKIKLKERGYNVSDFYQLLAAILRDFNNLVLENENSNLSMYGKSLEVLYYVLFDITSGIFRVNFKLTKLASKRKITERDITEAFNRYIKPGLIYKLSSGKIITETVSYSGDHLYPKITSHITEQEALPGATRGKAKRRVVGDDHRIDISMMEAGSVLFLPKSNPTPTARVNPFIMLNMATGTIMPNPKFDEIRQQTELTFKGKI